MDGCCKSSMWTERGRRQKTKIFFVQILKDSFGCGSLFHSGLFHPTLRLPETTLKKDLFLRDTNGRTRDSLPALSSSDKNPACVFSFKFRNIVFFTTLQLSYFFHLLNRSQVPCKTMVASKILPLSKSSCQTSGCNYHLAGFAGFPPDFYLMFLSRRNISWNHNVVKPFAVVSQSPGSTWKQVCAWD